MELKNKEVIAAVTIERLIEAGKVVAATYSRESKINLGNYESTGVAYSYTLEYPNVEEDAAMPEILNKLVIRDEVKIKHAKFAERNAAKQPVQ